METPPDRDSRLERVYDVVNVPEETRNLLFEKHRIDTFEDFCAKRRSFSSKRYRNVDQVLQVHLATAIDFFDKAKSAKRGRDGPDILESFTEDSFSKFVSERSGDGCLAIEPELKHVYGVLDLSERAQSQLQEIGIYSFAGLCSRSEDLEQQSIGGVKKTTQQSLYYVVNWANKFFAERQQQPNVLRDFTEESYLTSRNESEHKGIASCYIVLRSCLHDNAGKNLLQLLPPDQYPLLYKHGANQVMEKYLSEEIKSKKWCRDFTQRWMEAVINLPSEESFAKSFVLMGRTQSGKSAVKATVSATGLEAKCPTIIITKGVSESKELHSKLQKYAHESGRDDTIGKILCASLKQGETWKRKKDEVLRALLDGGTLVCADTARQVEKANQSIDWIRETKQNHKFCLVVDEADAMYRTPEECKKQKFEVAFDAIVKKNPSLKIFITATPVPVLLLFNKQGMDIEMLSITPDSDYCGVEEMKILKDERGENLFLSRSDLRCSEGYGFDEAEIAQATAKYKDESGQSDKLAKFHRPSGRHIPYTNEKAMRLYDDALLRAESKGILVLDITNPRVYADGNVFQKATALQDIYFAKETPFGAIVFVGKGIAYRLPGHSHWSWADKFMRICDVIDMIEEEYPDLSLPIFVFGYSKMRRGMSFRSTARVPTHILMNMGTGYSNESVVQCLGRATFTGKSILLKNGHRFITLLTTANDWDMVQTYLRFVQYIQNKVDEGVPPNQILSGQWGKLPSNVNYKKFTNRKTGQMKKGELCQDLEVIEYDDDDGSELTDGQKHTRDILKDHDRAQRLMRVLVDLLNKDVDEFHPVTNIMDAYNDTYMDFPGPEELRGIAKTELLKNLRLLESHCIVKKKQDMRIESRDKRKVWLWGGSPSFIDRFVGDLAYVAPASDDEYQEDEHSEESHDERSDESNGDSGDDSLGLIILNENSDGFSHEASVIGSEAEPSVTAQEESNDELEESASGGLSSFETTQAGDSPVG